jgi:hypothetical protein
MVAKHKASAKWRFLLGAEAWTEAKAKAKQQARSAEVLALVGGHDSVVRERDHILDAPAFLKFITRSDGMGSLGLGWHVGQRCTGSLLASGEFTA